jgi:small neutral amino acid transporter SnatA (MarC family)
MENFGTMAAASAPGSHHPTSLTKTVIIQPFATPATTTPSRRTVLMHGMGTETTSSNGTRVLAGALTIATSVWAKRDTVLNAPLLTGAIVCMDVKTS